MKVERVKHGGSNRDFLSRNQQSICGQGKWTAELYDAWIIEDIAERKPLVYHAADRGNPVIPGQCLINLR